ncbi:MAG: FAD-dependent oxidoreductase [Myxococcales bacterium]|nr:FAD-dependent oxidoreductase [Myxococcales bacterium]
MLPSSVHYFAKLTGTKAAIDAAGFMRKHGGTFRWGTRPEPWRFTFEEGQARPGETYAYQVERARFDKLMLDAARDAGAEIRQPCNVTGLIEEQGRVVGVRYRSQDEAEHELRARYVIDSTGHGSRMARAVGQRQYSEVFRNVAGYGYWRHPEPVTRENVGDILCEAFDEGWAWHIPLSPTLVSIGVVVDSRHAGRFSGDAREAVDFFLQRCPMIRGALAKARPIGDGCRQADGCASKLSCAEGSCIYAGTRVRKDYSYTNSRFWIPGLALIGDAACFIDPVFSSGIHLAQHAALQVTRAINTTLAGAASERRCFEEFERRYRLEYLFFCTFLRAFYQMNQSEEHYFWQASRLLAGVGNDRESFVRLVSGGATRGALVHDDSGLKLEEALVDRATLLNRIPLAGERINAVLADKLKLPLYSDGLSCSEYDLEWFEPGRGRQLVAGVLRAGLSGTEKIAAFVQRRS